MTTPVTIKGTLIKGATHTILLRVVGSSLMVIVSIVLGRNLGPTQYGIYSYSLAIIGILSIPASMGLPELISRQSAIYFSEERWSEFKGLFIGANFGVIGLSTLLIATSILSAVLFAGNHNVYFENFLISLALLPLIALGEIRTSFLRGLQKIFHSQLPGALIQPLAFLLSLFILARSSIELTANSAMFARILSFTLTFVLGAAFLRFFFPKEGFSATPDYRITEWTKSSSFFLLIGGLFLLQKQIDILMLGYFESSAVVGIYKVAGTAAGLVGFALKANNTAAGPIFAKLARTREFGKLQSLTTSSARLVFIAGFPLAMLFVFAGKDILRVVYGPEFADAGMPLVILSLGQIVNLASGSVALLLSMSGYEATTAKVLFATSILNILLNLLLIPKFGINGAALSTAFSVASSNLFLTVMVYRKLGINPTIFGKLF